MNENEVRMRLKVCEFIIELLEKETDDPRQPDALEHYKEQQRMLKSRLPKIPDTVIGLKTATITAKVPRLGE